MEVDGADRSVILKKTLKKWEAAFYETHERKPSRNDIETAPQRIQDTYRDYSKLRKAGGGNETKAGASSKETKDGASSKETKDGASSKESKDGASSKETKDGASSKENKDGASSKETKDGASLKTDDKLEAWGSHLNKSKTIEEDKSSDSQHQKGSLLSNLSQKLFQNYSHSKKAPRRSNQSAASSEHALQESSISNGSPEKTESNDADLSSMFTKSSALKFTSNSAKLHNRKLGEGPACGNILLKSQDKRRSLKTSTDWLDKCKPVLKKKKPANVKDLSANKVEKVASDDNLNRSLSKEQGRPSAEMQDELRDEIHQSDEDSYLKNFNDSLSSNQRELRAEIHKSDEENYLKNFNDSLSSNQRENKAEIRQTNVCKQNSSESIITSSEIQDAPQQTDDNHDTQKKVGTSTRNTDMFDDKGNEVAPQQTDHTQKKDRNRTRNTDICDDKGKKQSKRKRSEDENLPSKRSKQSEELEEERHNNNKPFQQLSSFESFEIPEDMVAGQSDEARKGSKVNSRIGEEDGSSEDEVERKYKKKVKKSVSSAGSSSSASATAGPKKSMNENFVKLNMRYKSYSRGRNPGKLKGSAYKRHVWKQREKGGAPGGKGGSGRGRGTPGWGKAVFRTEDTCFKCGNKGHWAGQCTGQPTPAPKKDIEKDWAMDKVGDDEEFPTLEEAAWAASGIKPDKEAIANGLKAPVAMPLVYEEPIPPPPIKPLYGLDEDDQIISTPTEVFDALQDMGFTSFRQGQEHTVMRILSGLSTLVVLSTGAGKSLTYQLPAYIYAKRGPCLTLVISPLVSLMDDQIFGLPKCLKGARLHSNMSKVQREKVVAEIIAGNVNVLLLSPEAIVGGGGTGGGCLPSLDKLPPIAFACIDEAHCVSEWSHNFRPSYLMLCRVLRERLGVQCLLGLTATATMATANSVAEHLGIAGDADAVVRGSSVPNNLMLSVSRDPNRERAIIDLLDGERFRELDSIIVYCIRREETEKVSSLLRTCIKADPNRETVLAVDGDEGTAEAEEEEGKKKKGKKKKGKAKKAKLDPNARPPVNSVESYHAGKSPAQRRKVQNLFMCGKLRVVVATVAFGMGLDKADVRAVIHYNLPKSFESYVQEIGRAGRDGKPSHCHVFLDPEGSDLCELRRHTYANSIDRITIKKLVKKVFPPCKCRQLQNLTSDTTTEQESNIDEEASSKTSPETTPIDEEASSKTSPEKTTIDEEASSKTSPETTPIEQESPEVDQSQPSTNGGEEVKLSKNVSERICPGHQVAIPTDGTIEELDIKEESIATLLCYLELHKKRWIRNLPPLYATCNIICYGGPAELRATAKKCPPVAVAIARKQIKGKSFRHANNVEFNAVEVASSMGWDVAPVKRELRQLQWKQIPGRGWVKSGILVEFSELALSLRAPGDLADEDFDEVIEFLAERTHSQEKRELYQLQSVYSALHSVSCKHYAQCCDSINEDSSSHLKDLLRKYFQAENTDTSENTAACEWFTPASRRKPETQDGHVRGDVRQFIGLHSDRTFNGRAIARIFHGIASPCYPAPVWGRDRRFWRRHLDFDFNKLVKIATEEVLRMR